MTIAVTRRPALALLTGWFLAPAWALEYTDHPLLSGMADFSVRSKTEKAFDAIELQPAEVCQAAGTKYTGPLVFEGKVTRLTYGSPVGKHSGLEVLRNYQAAIARLGGKQLNKPPAGEVYPWQVFRIEAEGKAPVSVLLSVAYDYEYELVVIEHQAMAQTVQAGELARQIESSGFATVYINFDTNQSTLKADGQAAVKEIVLLMKQSPKLKLSIEGHTDNVGAPADNKKLSQARADAVLKAAVAQGVDAKRLAAVGRGQDVPIADNRTEAGRAKNRRVELVKQG
ncbi:MAG: OmpA family protein [Burkholderiaceae bacterium]